MEAATLAAPHPARPYDEAMMALACAEAERGRGRTTPNPLVGAVVADEEGGPKVLSVGFHARAGDDHAEVAALRPLGGRAPGLTLYVTLEPCNHVGRTGRCTDALLVAGVRRVVVGLRDPNPGVFGGGIERLRAAGLEVDIGVLEARCRWQNRGYLRWLATGLPQLTLKAAASLDGRLAPRGPPPGAPIWLTGPAARQRAHVLRDEADAVMVGAGTVIADDPVLTVRLPEELTRDGRQPLRVVLDGALRAPAAAQVFGPGTLLITSEPAAAERGEHLRRLQDQGVEVAVLAPPASTCVPPTAPLRGAASPSGGGDGRTDLDPRAVAALLGRRPLHYVLCEGGAGLHGAFLGAGLYQEAALFVAPLFLGDAAVPLCRGFSPEVAPRLQGLTTELIGSDLLLRGAFPEEEHVHRPG